VNGVQGILQYSYNDPSNILTITDPNGNVQKEYFDGLGRLTEVQTYNGSVAYSEATYTYNWQNQVATYKTPAGDIHTYTYDSLGRLVQVTNPDGTTITTQYDTQSSTGGAQYGNGANGALTIQAGYWYNLGQNENFTSLTIPAGSTLNTEGHIIRVSGTLSNYGTITDSYDQTYGGSGGSAVSDSAGQSGGSGQGALTCASGQRSGAGGQGAGAGGSGPDESPGGNGGSINYEGGGGRGGGSGGNGGNGQAGSAGNCNSDSGPRFENKNFGKRLPF
jgi:YD repeat-containing protein